MDEVSESGRWLASLGFDRGNPFYTSEAGQERSLLPHYYVDVTGYASILDSRSRIMAAPRGCGKTALRIMAAAQAAPRVPDAPILVVEYIRFDEVVQAQSENSKLSLDQHRPYLVAHAADALLQLFCGDITDDDLILAQRRARAAALLETTIVLLARFLKEHAPRLLEPHHLLRVFKAFAGNHALHNANHFLRAAENGQLSEWVDSHPQYRAHETAILLAKLNDFKPTSPISNTSTIFVVEEFVQLSHDIGFDAVHILVDRIDEYPQTAQNPALQAALLEPLLTTLPLLEMARLAFKFFIPDETYATLEQSGKLRLDRYPKTAVQVSWKNEQLKELLQRRLNAFSSGRITDLAQICLDQNPRLAAEIEAGLVRFADHTPRRMLLGARYLVDAHLARVGPSGWLEQADWSDAMVNLQNDRLLVPDAFADINIETGAKEDSDQAIVTTLERNSAPTLVLRPRTHSAAIGGNALELTPLEFRVLVTIAQARNGRCSRDDLIAEAWFSKRFAEVASSELGSVSNATVDRTIARIRRQLKDSARKPTYLATVRGWGYELRNYQLDAD